MQRIVCLYGFWIFRDDKLKNVRQAKLFHSKLMIHREGELIYLPVPNRIVDKGNFPGVNKTVSYTNFGLPKQLLENFALYSVRMHNFSPNSVDLNNKTLGRLEGNL